MPLDLLNIDSLHLNVCVPRQRPEWRSMAPRLEYLAQARLGVACEQECAALLTGDPGVYAIERLELELSLNGQTLTDRDFTTQLSHAIVNKLQDALVRPNGVRILRFASEADFLATFLNDLLQGQAWEKWYYQCFRPLRALSLGQITMQLLIEDSSRGHEALVLLAQSGGLERLMAELNESQAKSVVEHCLLTPGMPDVMIPNVYSEWVDALTGLLEGSGPHMLARSNLHKAVLWLYLSLLRSRPELGPDSTLARFVADLLLLRQAISVLPQPSHILAFLSSGELRPALSLLGSRAPARALTLLAALVREVAPQQVAGLVSVLLQHGRPSSAAEPSRSTETSASTSTTLFGGLFLLVPAIVRLGVSEWLARCPYPHEEDLSFPKIKLLLSVLALQALGAQWAQQGMHDSGIAWFAGLEAGLDKDALNAYAKHIAPPTHHDFLQQLSAYLDTPEPGTLVRGLGVHRLRAFRLMQGEEPVLEDSLLDAVFSVLTDNVLREFTRSLRGFEESSPDYVRHNLLLGPARLQRDATRLHVQFERCPLEVVLRLAGLDREQPSVSWWDGRRLEIAFED